MASSDTKSDRSDLDRVKDAIRELPSGDRAALRPWLLATYDVRGYPERRASSRDDAGHD
jgi:hypothetical protein